MSPNYIISRISVALSEGDLFAFTPRSPFIRRFLGIRDGYALFALIEDHGRLTVPSVSRCPLVGSSFYGYPVKLRKHV